jgi:flavin reductase (DIM6/NTAB) family NADH-FMN oxidoreductase RutF
MKSLLKWLVLGNETLPQQVTVAIREPQSEIAVWLYGKGAPRDVTHLHSIACASPFTVCIPFDNLEKLKEQYGGDKAVLELRERAGSQRLLGKIGLRFNMTIPAGESYLGLFRVKSCVNYCVPKIRFWGHYLQQAYWRWRDKKVPNVRMSATDEHAMMVMFICPRPVVLVTTMEENGGNLFPMNLMGHLGGDYFSLALNRERQASACVKRSGRVALSSIPFEKADLARQLARHHLQASIDWNQLPFHVKDSSGFGVPVPEFALRVRELEVQDVEELGSHTFFVARILHEEIYADGPAFFMIHGIYQRVRTASTENVSPQRAYRIPASAPKQ